MTSKTTLNISIPVQVTPDARAAYAESLQMILQHVADFHLTLVDIISEKYKIPVDEIVKTVTSDSRYTNMVVDPKIHRLQQSQQDVIKISDPDPVPSKKKIIEKKIKIKPKNAVLLP